MFLYKDSELPDIKFSFPTVKFRNLTKTKTNGYKVLFTKMYVLIAFEWYCVMYYWKMLYITAGLQPFHTC